MAGHSKFANIKHKKEKMDLKRGKIFTKLGKEITVATRIGGDDITFNPRLRLAIDRAKVANMPKENIDKAIKKGSGNANTDTLLEITYQGYGISGVALVVDALTDNKNRTASEVRHAFNKFGGSMSDVSWLFDKKGVIVLGKDVVEENVLFDLVTDLDVDDILVEDKFKILTDPSMLYKISESIPFSKEIVEISMLPKNRVTLSDEDRDKFMDMVQFIEDLDDVQRVYHNAEL